MRDIFSDLFAQQPVDPVEAARRSVRPQLRRRFYQAVSVVEVAPQAFAVALDDRRMRTPAGAAFLVPAHGLADLVAEEWRRQPDVIDPADMPLTRLGNTIVDGVEKATRDVSADVLKYLSSDLLFYRADAPAGLVAWQAAQWDPILAWARDVHGARFILAEGINFVAQPESAVAALAATLPSDAWRLGAVHTVTTLTGSALIALALAAGHVSADAAWAAAHVDEDWNMQTWGRDETALQRRAFREREMRAAAAILHYLAG